jgi:hypothetical protein
LDGKTFRATLIRLGVQPCLGLDLAIRLVEAVRSHEDGIFPGQEFAIRIVIARGVQFDESDKV